jgi:hypothetical protein
MTYLACSEELLSGGLERLVQLRVVYLRRARKDDFRRILGERAWNSPDTSSTTI